MRLITLNIWGGIAYEPLLEFIRKHSEDTDIFCFQEVLFGDIPGFTETHRGRINIFDELSAILSDFDGYKHISDSNHFQKELITFGAGQAIFVRKNIKVKDSGGFLCYEKLPGNTDKGGKLTGNLQWISIEFGGEKFIISNLHGLWQEGSLKLDTPERLVQSEKIKDFLNKTEGKKIICGDFNLAHNGQSIAILGEGMRNLVIEYDVQSTRSGFYHRPYKLGDYILVSSDIKVKDFEVLQDQISDHLPLLVDFNF